MDPPLKPDESDCCNSGCNPCILDIYEEQLKKFNERKTKEELSSKSYKNCLLTTAYTIFKVVDIENHANNALLMTFEFLRFLKDSESVNLMVMFNPGQYFMLKAGPKNEEFQKPYTPIPIYTANILQFTILVRIYEVGQMSRYIKKLKIGSETIWRAQGVGIAPFYSIICNILSNENCDTFLKLYYCCKSCDAVYLRDRLYDLQSHWNFSYEIFLSDSENSSKKYNETIYQCKLDEKKIQNYFSDKVGVQALICGSENFMSYFKDAVIDCKIEEENIFLF